MYISILARIFEKLACILDSISPLEFIVVYQNTKLTENICKPVVVLIFSLKKKKKECQLWRFLCKHCENMTCMQSKSHQQCCKLQISIHWHENIFTETLPW